MLKMDCYKFTNVFAEESSRLQLPANINILL